MPKPRASPCTNVVLPAPRSPWSASVTSAGRARANSAASDCVSAAVDVVTPTRSLSQMFVATVGVELNGVRRNFVFAHKTSDARKPRAWKGAAPRACEHRGIRIACDGENELVVLTVGERVANRRAAAARQRVGLERGRGADGRECVEILREAIAHVHHRASFGAARKPRA